MYMPPLYRSKPRRHSRGVVVEITIISVVQLTLLLLFRSGGSHYYYYYYVDTVESFPSSSSSSIVRIDLVSRVLRIPHSPPQRLFFATTKATTSQSHDTSSNHNHKIPPSSSSSSKHSVDHQRRKIPNATNAARLLKTPMVNNNNITNNNNNSIRKSATRRDDFRSQLRATQRQLLSVTTTTTTPASAPYNNNNNNNNNSDSTNHTTTTSIPLTQQLSQSYLDYLFAECVAHNEWDLAYTDVVPVMTAAHRSVQYSTYNACLQACFQTGNAGSAQRILHILQQESSRSHPNVPPPQINDYTLVLLAMCRNDQSESGWCQKAIQLLEEVKRTTSQQDVPITVYDAIFTRLIPTRQWKTSVQLLQRMENEYDAATTTKPVLSTYRTVIECCVAANQANVAYQVLKSYLQQDERRRRSSSPAGEHLATSTSSSSYLFEMVIVALSKQTQWRRAVQLLDHMCECQIPRTLVLYNSILIACSKAREPVAAKSLYQRLKRDDLVRPNIISYNTAIAACGHDFWRDALLIFDEMQREPGVTPDICTYTK